TLRSASRVKVMEIDFTFCEGSDVRTGCRLKMSPSENGAGTPPQFANDDGERVASVWSGWKATVDVSCLVVPGRVSDVVSAEQAERRRAMEAKSAERMA